MKFAEGFSKFIKNVTVEPVIFLTLMSSQFASLTSQNLFLETACRVNLQFSDEVCQALKNRNAENFTEEETQVQLVVAGMQNWRIIIQTVVPTLMVFFWGSWSDRHGKRK